MESIYLIGFMGVGKTSVGTLLGEKLKYPIYDLDEEIERLAGCTISDLFATKGESYFRKLESKCLLDAPTENAVISTGGGVVLAVENRDFLQQAQYVIQLKAKVETISKRLKNDQSRPLLQEKSLEDMESLYRSRYSQYAESSTLDIETDELSVQEVTDLILKGIY